MIRLEKVCERTFDALLDMKLPEEQDRFVAPNIVSLAQAWLYYDHARPFAILDGDEPVGFIMFDWDTEERCCGVWRFMIAHDKQHMGYGRQAMTAALQMIRDAGLFDVVKLDYVPGNEIARDLYYSFGFRENGDIDDGEIIMTLPLTDRPTLCALTADEEDIEGFAALLNAERLAGADVPAPFVDPGLLKRAVAEGRVKRFTLMGKTAGLAADGIPFLAREYAGYLPLAQALSRG